MRTFTVYRKNPPADAVTQGRANPPGEPQFQGVVFDDGSVAVRWLTQFRSVSTWDSLESLKQVHGHPEYGTEWVWDDDGLAEALRQQRAGELAEPYVPSGEDLAWARRELPADSEWAGNQLDRIETLAASRLDQLADVAKRLDRTETLLRALLGEDEPAAGETREIGVRKRSPDEVRKRLLSAGTVLPPELAQQLTRELAQDLEVNVEGCAR